MAELLNWENISLYQYKAYQHEPEKDYLRAVELKQ